MVLVSNRLVHQHLDTHLLSEAFDLLQEDLEIQSYLRMSNIMAVKRLGYNDHGPVHSKIIAGSALEIFRLITTRVEPSSVTNGVCDYDDAKLIVLLGAYLHDLGNAIHRIDHALSINHFKCSLNGFGIRCIDTKWYIYFLLKGLYCLGK